MTRTEELIVKEIGDFPESYLVEVLEYIRSLKARAKASKEGDRTPQGRDEYEGPTQD